MHKTLTGNNRANIPAVCRIKGRGTATLISPGILLTSRHVVDTPEMAMDLTAIFFESTKKKPVEVKMLPQNLFFTAFYPDYMDYCIVACEQSGIFNVTPVNLPLTKGEWAPVREGDTILVVQHPLDDSSNEGRTDDSFDTNSDLGAKSLEVKRFEEVLRCRNDLYYLKANGNSCTFGCPVFNEFGQLIGLQSQMRYEGEGIINRVLSIASIVRHLFANKQLRRIRRSVAFDEVWDTWYIKDDVSRIVFILENFTNYEITRPTAQKLCEHALNPNLVESVVGSGGIQCILSSLQKFKEDEAMVCVCIRAIWNVSFGETNAQELLVNCRAVEMVLDAIETYPDNEEIAEYSVVFLYNISTGNYLPDFDGPLGDRALAFVYAKMQHFKETTVLQKFGLGFFTSLINVNIRFAESLVKLRIVEHLVALAEKKQDQVFLMEALMNCVGELTQHRKAIDLCFANEGAASTAGSHGIAVLTSLLIDIMLRYQEMDTILLQGNRALWGIGNDMNCRAIILQHPKSYEALKLSLPALIARARLT